MRVNVYAEEMTDRVEIISKTIDGHQFTGLRIYLELPATVNGQQYQGPFMHRPGDDDSSAVTFWGKRDLREVLRKALAMLDDHYAERELRQIHASRTDTIESVANALSQHCPHVTVEHAVDLIEDSIADDHAVRFNEDPGSGWGTAGFRANALVARLRTEKQQAAESEYMYHASRTEEISSCAEDESKKGTE